MKKSYILSGNLDYVGKVKVSVEDTGDDEKDLAAAIAKAESGDFDEVVERYNKEIVFKADYVDLDSVESAGY